MTSAGRSQLQRLATVEVGKPMHVLLTREPSGKTTVYINRRSAGVFTSGDSINDWKPGMLRFGSVRESEHTWRGQIERVAVYSRALRPAEAESHARVAYRSIHERTVHRRWNVECRLVETSDLPGLQEIQPYKEGLIRRLFEVKRNLSGDGLLPPRIVVTQWVWLGGRPMPAQDLKVGDMVILTLEEPQAHPELHSLYVKDQLTEDFDALQLIDVSELDEPVMRISPDSPTI